MRLLRRAEGLFGPSVIENPPAGLPSEQAPRQGPVLGVEREVPMRFAPFSLERWLDENAALLKPPVGNKLVFENTGMVVQVIGGPNQRVDFHDDPVEEFFYQLKGDMVLKIAAAGGIADVPIRQGEVLLIPPHTRHSPQRPAGSLGLVVEGTRRAEDIDAFEWFCFGCGARVHRVEVKLTNIVTDLPPLSPPSMPTARRGPARRAARSIPARSRRRVGRGSDGRGASCAPGVHRGLKSALSQ
jgi:3-hydroxyanthranilate 3,4-dioxygenase